MNVLGIHDGHNGTAAVFKEGRVIACVSEERFSGQKNHYGFPFRSVEYCLQQAGIASEELDGVMLGFQEVDPFVAHNNVKETFGIQVGRPALNVVRRLRAAWRTLEYRCPPVRPLGRWGYDRYIRLVGHASMVQRKRFVAEHLGVALQKVDALQHHLAHAATAYYGSPYAGHDAIILTLDGFGDRVCAAVYTVRAGRFECLATTHMGSSLGLFYCEATRYLGLKPMEDEYKLMGLAPYASEQRAGQVYDRLREIITLDPRQPLRFQSSLDTQLTYRFLRDRLNGLRFDDIAAGVQRLLEERVVEWVRQAVHRTGLHTVVAAGGVFMNVKANLRIAELPEVERFFPFPTAGDESTPIGVCYWMTEQQGLHVEARQPFHDVYLGPAFTEEEAWSAIRVVGCADRYRVSREPDIEERIADLLAQGEIVARVHGRMEWGARALGNRSILAHPSDPDVVRVINQMIKARDFWMPFAPTILAERASDYLMNPKNIPAAFMAICFRSTPRAQRELRAALHPYDGTLRPQVLTEAMNPSYYRVLKAFERRTGVGGVLNTSYNLHGSPLVLGPREALDTFERSGLQHLALGPFWISKTAGPTPEKAVRSAATVQAPFCPSSLT